MVIYIWPVSSVIEASEDIHSLDVIHTIINRVYFKSIHDIHIQST